MTKKYLNFNSLDKKCGLHLHLSVIEMPLSITKNNGLVKFSYEQSIILHTKEFHGRCKENVFTQLKNVWLNIKLFFKDNFNFSNTCNNDDGVFMEIRKEYGFSPIGYCSGQ